MARKYREWSDNDLIEAVKNNTSVSGVLRQLNLKPSGGNHLNIKRNISRLNLDISHFTGSVWNKGVFGPLFKLKNPQAIKNCLIQTKGHKCEVCNNSTWNGVPITLELEHIDGNRCNNEESNLKLLCCNCHSQTPTWRNRKRSKGTIQQ